jgi:hypothetical protein
LAGIAGNAGTEPSGVEGCGCEGWTAGCESACGIDAFSSLGLQPVSSPENRQVVNKMKHKAF